MLGASRRAARLSGRWGPVACLPPVPLPQGLDIPILGVTRQGSLFWGRSRRRKRTQKPVDKVKAGRSLHHTRIVTAFIKRTAKCCSTFLTCSYTACPGGGDGGEGKVGPEGGAQGAPRALLPWARALDRQSTKGSGPSLHQPLLWTRRGADPGQQLRARPVSSTLLLPARGLGQTPSQL